MEVRFDALIKCVLKDDFFDMTTNYIFNREIKQRINRAKILNAIKIL